MKKISTRKLRDVAGRFATGVTIVSTKDTDLVTHGMTANSFVSLSFDPPLVMFSVMETGRMLQHFSPGKKVGISILGDHQADISNKFAGLGSEEADFDFLYVDDCPIVKECLAWYATRVEEVRKVGDHWLIVCMIEDLAVTSNESPLIYYQGYRTLGE